MGSPSTEESKIGSCDTLKQRQGTSSTEFMKNSASGGKDFVESISSGMPP